MPVLPNPRHEQFCQHRALGKTVEEAFALAGYKPQPKNASRLMGFEGVRERIAELQAERGKTYEVTAESIAAELDAAIEFAKACKQPSAIVSAIATKAKLFGLLTDRSVVNVTHNYTMMTVEELHFEIAALTAEARQIKAGLQN